jgi:hypothetical protein
VHKPESLVTADPGLATAPPEQLALQNQESGNPKSEEQPEQTST